MTLPEHRVAILDLYNGMTNHGIRAIKEILDRFGDRLLYDWFDTRKNNEFPLITEYDIIISSGGPGDPRVMDGPWHKGFFDFFQQVWDWNQSGNPSRKYAFFICHSFQLACMLFEVGEITKRHATSFGTFPTYKTIAGLHEPLFEKLPHPFWTADFRLFQVTNPDLNRLRKLGAEILAMEGMRRPEQKGNALMAVRFSDEFFATQFHSEADPLGMRGHFSDPKRKEEVIKEHGEKRYHQMLEDLQQANKIPLTHDTILPTYLARCIEALDKQKTPVLQLP